MINNRVSIVFIIKNIKVLLLRALWVVSVVLYS